MKKKTHEWHNTEVDRRMHSKNAKLVIWLENTYKQKKIERREQEEEADLLPPPLKSFF